MNTALAVCLIAVAFHLLAVPALIYAIRTRQLRESDQEAYRTVQGSQDAVPRRPSQRTFLTPAGRPVTRLRVRLFFGLIITMLVMMCGAQVYLAVISAHTPATMEDPN